MPSNSIKCKHGKLGYLGKIIPVALKYLIYAMQNSGTPQAHGSDLAPVKYVPTGLTAYNK
jgi:hypothetical protein